MYLDNFNILKDYLLELYSNNYFVYSVLVYLIIATYTDIKTMKIPNKLNLTFLIIRFLLIFVGFEFTYIHLIGGICGILFLLIPAVIKMHKMGGDIKLMGVLGLYLGMYNAIPFLIATTFFSAIVSIPKSIITKKKENFPFAPFFLTSHVLFIIISLTDKFDLLTGILSKYVS